MSRPAFNAGQRVRIADHDPGCHHRVPGYAKGRAGVIERVCGEHGRPEAFIRGDGAPPTRIYRISLDPRDLWADYQGAAADRVEVEIFEHWLEPGS